MINRGYAFAEDVHAAKGAGMNDHIAKPLDIDVMMETIENVIKSNSNKNNQAVI